MSLPPVTASPGPPQRRSPAVLGLGYGMEKAVTCALPHATVPKDAEVKTVPCWPPAHPEYIPSTAAMG